MYLGISRRPDVVVRSGSARWAGRVLASAGLQVTLVQILKRVMAFMEEIWCNSGTRQDMIYQLVNGDWRSVLFLLVILRVDHDRSEAGGQVHQLCNVVLTKPVLWSSRHCPIQRAPEVALNLVLGPRQPPQRQGYGLVHPNLSPVKRWSKD